MQLYNHLNITDYNEFNKTIPLNSTRTTLESKTFARCILMCENILQHINSNLRICFWLDDYWCNIRIYTNSNLEIAVKIKNNKTFDVTIYVDEHEFYIDTTKSHIYIPTKNINEHIDINIPMKIYELFLLLSRGKKCTYKEKNVTIYVGTSLTNTYYIVSDKIGTFLKPASIQPSCYIITHICLYVTLYKYISEKKLFSDFDGEIVNLNYTLYRLLEIAGNDKKVINIKDLSSLCYKLISTCILIKMEQIKVIDSPMLDVNLTISTEEDVTIYENNLINIYESMMKETDYENTVEQNVQIKISYVLELNFVIFVLRILTLISLILLYVFIFPNTISYIKTYHNDVFYTNICLDYYNNSITEYLSNTTYTLAINRIYSYIKNQMYNRITPLEI